MNAVESASRLEPGFSVADSGYPSLSLNGGILRVEFVDWQEQSVAVMFSNVAAIKWEEIDSSGPELRNDCTYEICNSVWLAALLDSGARSTSDQLRHFKLCFNSVGVLQVLADSIQRVV